MKRAYLAVLLSALAWAPSVHAADRLTDKDSKSLVERLDDERSKFKDALDSSVKHNVLKGPNGDVDVDRYLDDFKDGINRLKDRMKSDYSASTEAAAVLRQGSEIENFFRRQSPGTKGESEWNKFATDLSTLANAYGTTFPVPEGAPVRRLTDKEIEDTASSIADGAGRLKSALDEDLKHDTSVDAAARSSAVSSADELSKNAKALKSRVDDGKPSSAEAERVLSDASAIQRAIAGHQAPKASAAWASLGPKFEALSVAYRIPWQSK